MPLTIIESAPQGALTVNQWTIEIDGVGYASVARVDGMTKEVGVLEVADGGSGHTFKFDDGKKNYGPLTVVQIVDPRNANDRNMADFVNNAMASGSKYNIELIKYHHAQRVFSVAVTGAMFRGEAMPSFDKNTQGLFEISYTVENDYWELIWELAAAAVTW